jgi:hypothetical protein
MSDIINISSLNKEFKTTAENQQFIEAQLKTIKSLMNKNKLLEEEIVQLRQMLSVPTVEKVIVTPEQALIEDQILIIQNRSYLQELSLEDVKKLDLLLKNKLLIKRADPKTVDGKSSYQKMSDTQLLEIASKHGNE